MSKVFIIAEAGVNHNGDESMAMELVDIAARCGADAVKFQTFSADKLVSRGTAKAAYQSRETGAGDQHSMLKALELTDEMHRRLVDRCALRGIEFMSTPFDEDAADMLMLLGMQRIKIPSGEITNLPFLRYLAAKGVPLIVSTGMADLGEIRQAVGVIKRAWQEFGIALGPDALTVLHCTSNYPAEYADVNMRAMHTIADATGIPVGYSDHTRGIPVSVAAVALGTGRGGLAAELARPLLGDRPAPKRRLARHRPGGDERAARDPQAEAVGHAPRRGPGHHASASGHCRRQHVGGTAARACTSSGPGRSGWAAGPQPGGCAR